MENEKELTFEEYAKQMLEAAKTLTQAQIDACAYVMGGSGCGWNKNRVIQALPIVFTSDQDKEDQEIINSFYNYNGNSDGTVGLD